MILNIPIDTSDLFVNADNYEVDDFCKEIIERASDETLFAEVIKRDLIAAIFKEMVMTNRWMASNALTEMAEIYRATL